MDDSNPSTTRNTFASAIELTSAQEADFRRRDAMFCDWRKANPGATSEEISVYREKVTPIQDDEAALYTKWCIEQMRKELAKT